MDYYTIRAQRHFLDRDLKGTRIEAVRLRDKYSLFIGFTGETAVKLSCTPDMPYLHRIEKRFLPVKNSHDWHLPRLKGQAVAGIALTPGDRILTFHLESGGRLVFEMTGRHANIVVIDPEGVIAGSLRTITARESGVREIRPGIPYIPPPGRTFPDLVWSPPQTLERLFRTGEGSVAEALARTLCAGSRLFALEACTRAGVDSGAPADSLGRDDLYGLFTVMAALDAEIEKGGSGATVALDREDLPYDVFPVRMSGDIVKGELFDDLNEAVMTYARTREVELERRSLRNSVVAALNREERRIRSTMRKVERERGGDDEPGRLERLGNTVLANLHNITRGMTSARLFDPYGTGEVEVGLDAKLDGPKNAERFFTRARKLRAAAALAEEHLSSLAERLERITAEREHLAGIEDMKELRTLSAQYTSTRSRGQRSAVDDEIFPRRFRSVSGLEIIVGRNDTENDKLVRWARKNDLWLHAQNVGGSHVILRSPGKQAPDHQSLEQAAAIAAFYSKAKTSAVVPVACTQVKYVVKRKGQGPGKVTYTREKVIFAEPVIPVSGTSGLTAAADE